MEHTTSILWPNASYWHSFGEMDFDPVYSGIVLVKWTLTDS